jgi:hypothetical protein
MSQQTNDVMPEGLTTDSKKEQLCELIKNSHLTDKDVQNVTDYVRRMMKDDKEDQSLMNGML